MINKILVMKKSVIASLNKKVTRRIRIQKKEFLKGSLYFTEIRIITEIEKNKLIKGSNDEGRISLIGKDKVIIDKTEVLNFKDLIFSVVSVLAENI
ncbi:hypothetical protein [Carnobacterium maltaromaticum]|uniref:hypothetical protein n=1 Tax=Carnobacterium maltaromaticum TaxID=2751 RepID=UPI0015E0F80C|nr:hypothetical protein [Carnobacterium maltaromaticum]